MIMGVAAFGIAPDTVLENINTHPVTINLPNQAISLSSKAEGFWREERVIRGDTLGSVLARLGVSDPDAQQFIRNDPKARTLYQLRPGKALRVQTDADGDLLALRYITAAGDELSIDRQGDRLEARKAAATTQTRLAMRGGEIRTSLFATADAIGLPDSVTLQLAEVFSGDIDFYHDLRRGDRFSVIYEVKVVDGEPVGTGRIIAAEFLNRGSLFRTFYWQDGNGEGGYYSADGISQRKAFLRSPMEFSRITSGFSLARFHPILQAWRAHKGVDYAAPAGTPVRVTGDGAITFAGSQNGYGNVVIVQHHGAFSTLYAHLSRLAEGVRTGAKIAQGAMVGYVGQTGWATGPHLHYEFRVNGEQHDPLQVAIPNVFPLDSEHRAKFLSAMSPLASHLELMRGTNIAIAE